MPHHQREHPRWRRPEDEERFVRQLLRLFQAVHEVDAGVRPVQQLARWFTEDALLKIRVWAELASRHRRLHHMRPRRPDVRVVRTMAVPTHDRSRIDCVIVYATGAHRTRVASVVVHPHRDRWIISDLALL
ncbi:Rv3235 family protein [Pseudoclavibacter caeni]|uniref:3-hydroxyacyl-CoA dehydrogenase n=1 Tax=Pseudoclavibacter caeni TaxID=908846 RepID=A0A7C8FTH5_9MICO|nr:Rv3235 family protein [Pseudoclavibacter caeni]KAB1631915.1 3-hydroxyacyl-CoA dehydrogenase [Pseudoclavibacter caeni]NYJ96890.1 hypothetical protein [Pseudoclavibacter caeni]